MGPQEVYFECVVLGRYAKVTAVCPRTHVEVSVTGPANASRRDLEALALRKLETRLKAERAGR